MAVDVLFEEIVSAIYTLGCCRTSREQKADMRASPPADNFCQDRHEVCCLAAPTGANASTSLRTRAWRDSSVAARTASWPLSCWRLLCASRHFLYVPTAIGLSALGHERVECTLHACILVGHEDFWRSVVAGRHKMLQDPVIGFRGLILQ